MKHINTLHQSLAGREPIGCSALNIYENFTRNNICLAWEGMLMPTGLRAPWNFHQHGRDFGIGCVRVSNGLPSGGCRRLQKRRNLNLLFVPLGPLCLRAGGRSRQEYQDKNCR